MNLLKQLKKKFIEHPKNIGETYLQHLWFSVKWACKFLLMACVALIHGVFPMFFVETNSNWMRKETAEANKRNFGNRMDYVGN